MVKCPYKKEQSKSIWALENFGVDRYDGIRELLNKNLDEYLKAGLSTFNQTDDTPIMLKAFLFSRFCAELIEIDKFKDKFKDWYNNVYYGISGKLCSKEGVIYSVNKQIGETYCSTVTVITPPPRTVEQQAIRADFKKKAQFASSWWRQNRPSSTSVHGSEAYLSVMKAYKAQHKIGNPYSFMRSLVTDDMKVILSGNDITGGVTSDGGSTSGSGSSTGGELEP